ncbi:bacteriorhodopsin [Haloterrigena sp. SYSU A558-1]|uniref:Bacteriorhodopsin n=1 Tax=Haloterrigena gelatinilytica TaxID=2741724 RepID=A0A8J8GKF3_9EURY|nr:bacteriorhodopsin [Haloterrigena gelatinilytica]NUB89979.1 bacteriorhodopsin [Haloterrigena gelatinilytica]NUC74196.1 bacteriorhodopsin [Haloterrigena gelatinilytica]
MIGELEMYRLSSYVTAVATLAFLGWVAKKPAGTRRYFLPAPIVCGTLSLAYFGMSLELLRVTTPNGQPLPMSRYVDYFVATTIMIAVAGKVADATRRQLATLIALTIGWIGFSLGRYFLTGAAVLAANLGTAVALAALLYVMIWPVTKRSGETSGERVLLYGKLRNLIILLWIAYLVIGVISRQGLGLLDAFGGVFAGAYLDIATRIGFGLLLLRGSDAMANLIDDVESNGGSGEPGDEVTFAESSGDSDADPDIEPAD